MEVRCYFQRNLSENMIIAFIHNTFMYNEESILNYIAKRDSLITVYFPKIKVYHKEDSSNK